MTDHPFDTVLVPLANEDDAAATCQAVDSFVPPKARIIAIHVIEKAGGAMDKASVEQREEHAERIFDVANRHFADTGHRLDTELHYGTDVAETIFQAAAGVDADAICYTPREASRLVRLLSGDTSLDLVTGADRPVVVLPDPEAPD